MAYGFFPLMAPPDFCLGIERRPGEPEGVDDPGILRRLHDANAAVCVGLEDERLTSDRVADGPTGRVRNRRDRICLGGTVDGNAHDRLLDRQPIVAALDREDQPIGLEVVASAAFTLAAYMSTIT